MAASLLVLFAGHRGVALKPDIKVETVNKETPSLEEDTAGVSTASRMVKAMYSVSMVVTEPQTLRSNPVFNTLSTPL